MKKPQDRMNVSLSKEVGQQVEDLQSQLADQLGFVPSMSQVVEFLLKQYLKTKTN